MEVTSLKSQCEFSDPFFNSWIDNNFSCYKKRPSMIVVQKLTSLAYSIHDGNARKCIDLSEDQERYAVRYWTCLLKSLLLKLIIYVPCLRFSLRLFRKMPTLLEFFSFIFSFPTLMSGPMFYFNDFVAFIEKRDEEYRKVADQNPLPHYSVNYINFIKLNQLF